MAPRDFRKLLSLLPEDDGMPDYRSALIVYTVSRGFRPAFGFEKIDQCTGDDGCRWRLQTFFSDRELNLAIEDREGFESFIYNTDLLDSDDLRTSKQDFGVWFGRLIGYPWPVSNDKFQEVRETGNLYEITYEAVLNGQPIWIFGYGAPRFNLATEELQSLKDMLAPLGVREVVVSVARFEKWEGQEEHNTGLPFLKITV